MVCVIMGREVRVIFAYLMRFSDEGSDCTECDRSYWIKPDYTAHRMTIAGRPTRDTRYNGWQMKIIISSAV